MSLQQGLIDLAIVSLLAALTPIVVGMLSRLRVPQVVVLIIGGIVVGPQVLGWAEPERLSGLIDRDHLHRGGTVARVGGSLRGALDAALSAPSRRGVLVDEAGRLVGTVRAQDVLSAIERRPAGVAT